MTQADAQNTAIFEDALKQLRRRFSILLILFFVALGTIGAGTALIIDSAVDQVNLVAQEASYKTAQSLLRDTRDNLDRLAVDYSWWDEAVENIRLRFNHDWIQSNYGQYLYDNEGLTHIAVVSAEGRLNYLAVDGSTRDPVSFAALEDKLRAVVASAAQADPASPRAVQDVVRALDRLFLVSASIVVPYDREHPGLEKTATQVLVLMRLVDQAFLDQLGGGYGLTDLRLGPAQMRDDLMYLKLTNVGGDPVEKLSWSLELPGHRLIEKIAPSLSALVVLLIAITVMVLHNLRRLNQKLVADNQTLVALSRDIESANAELARLSYVDGLTGIANRRKFDETLPQEWRRCQRYQLPMTILMIDIDNFKTFNDSYGHQQGDLCLRSVSETVAKQIKRPGDLLARYGGEELVCLLPGSDREGAEHLIERILQSVRDLNIPHSGSANDARVTVSLGGTTVVPGEAAEPESLVRQADEKLYAAKAAGRDRGLM